MKKLNNFLLILLPAILFFSYFPVISLGETATMHLELSLPEIWLAVFFFANLKNLKNLIKTFTMPKLIIISLFPLYASLSIFWSKNRLRAILTAGLLWLIVFAIINIIYHLKSADKILKRKIAQSLLISTALVCAFCWLQCLLDLIGFARADTLLCAGCTYASFGFPHPNGFAIEPQFMGNLLLAPTIFTFYLLFVQKTHHRVKILLLAALFSSTLFLTFSRGAIYAFIIAVMIFIVFFVRKNHKVLLTIPLICATLILTLTMQGIFSQLSPTSDTFYSGITKSIHQLTLGKLDFRPQQEAKSNDDPDNNTKDSNFSGYVEESTNRRVNLSNYALDIWDDSKTQMLFGTGLGSAGIAMSEKYGFDSAKEIVQNQYASLLLELGLTSYIILIFVGIKLKLKLNPLVLTIISAYAITLVFFAGLPNAIHIYLFPPLIFYLASKASLNHVSAGPAESKSTK